MIVWDDLQSIEKIRVYNRGVEVINSEANIYNTRIQYRTGDMYCPILESTEALSNEVKHIVQCLSGKAPSIVTGKSGWKVVKILEAAQLSIKNKGKEIKIH